VLDDEQWAGLAELLRADLAGAADLAGEVGRRHRADELDAVISGWTAGLDVHDAVARLRAAGVAAARVAAAADLLDDEQLAARGFWQEVEHPVIGRLMTVGMPFRLAGVPGPWFSTPAPLLGQHNAEVLGGLLGLSAGELAELAEQQVIGDRPAGL